MLQPPPNRLNYVIRGDAVRLAPTVPCVHLANALGECADESCGCNRLKFPQVRFEFRSSVIERGLEALRAAGRTSVRYVSVGCGMLLNDFEILCGFEAAGCTLESITFIDCDFGTRKYHVRRRRFEPGTA